MKGTTYQVIEAIKLLDPAKNFDLFADLGLKLSTTEIIYVTDIEIEGTMLYARGSRDRTFHMVPVDSVLGFEVEIKSNPWFLGVRTLPAIIAKLKDEAKRKAA